MEGNLKEKDIYRESLQIVDYVTALEALYILPDEKPSHLLSRRVAFLLAVDNLDAKRKSLQNFVKNLYALRGQIVHGRIKKENINRKKIERHYPASFYDEEGRIHRGSFVKRGETKYSVPEEVVGVLGLGSADYLTGVREIVRTSILKFLSMQSEGRNKEKIVNYIDKL